MKVNFDKKNDDGNLVSELIGGGYPAMIKKRKEQLPKIQDNIQEILENYSGESIAIILMKEDENGDVTGSNMLMSGVSKVESQIRMAKALNIASNKAMDILMKGVEGNPKARLQIASMLVDSIKEAQEDK